MRAGAAVAGCQPYRVRSLTRRHAPHRVLVNGVPLGESFDALKLFVCVAYTGKTKPAHCFDPPATAGAGSVLALPGRDGGMHPGAAA